MKAQRKCLVLLDDKLSSLQLPLGPKPRPLSPPEDSGDWYVSSHIDNVPSHTSRRFDNKRGISCSLSSSHPRKIRVTDIHSPVKVRPHDEVFPDFISDLVQTPLSVNMPRGAPISSNDRSWYISKVIKLVDPFFEKKAEGKIYLDFYREHAALLNRNVRITAVINQKSTLDIWATKLVDLFNCANLFTFSTSRKIFPSKPYSKLCYKPSKTAPLTTSDAFFNCFVLISPLQTCTVITGPLISDLLPTATPSTNKQASANANNHFSEAIGDSSYPFPTDTQFSSDSWKAIVEAQLQN